MFSKKQFITKLVFLSVLFFAAEGISAATKVVFVHGRSGDHCGTGNTDVNNYWGSGSNLNTGYEKLYVGYDGGSDPRDWGTCRAQSNLWTTLYNECTGGDNCYIICHSAGCLATDYFLSNYGFVTDDNGYDVNINWVFQVASASGGSELADMAIWAGSGMDYALKTGNARSFNHNIGGGASFWHIGGFDGWWYSSWRLPGEDDGAVSFHSTCGKNSTGSYDDCQTDGSQWGNHYVWTDSAQAGYNSGKQGFDRDHSEIKNETLPGMWNRLFGL